MGANIQPTADTDNLHYILLEELSLKKSSFGRHVEEQAALSYSFAPCKADINSRRLAGIRARHSFWLLISNQKIISCHYLVLAESLSWQIKKISSFLR